MKKGFILPLVLLILALMSGIAVVLGRLSSEKTLSLKKQEGSYYAKEITVTLVENGNEEGEEENEDLESEINELTSTSITLKKNKSETQKVEWKRFENRTYDVIIAVDPNDKINWVSKDKNGSEKFEVNGSGYTGSVIVGSNGKLTIYINYTNSTNSKITATAKGTYTKN
ncbi:hypothetical protein [uncultured Ilyobacter sp.]|uniref:hypothetical protein n=1 Tax=uncultured Ilyobacter sp. TaxID=544433 RepID=UPI0029C61E23|nr:hypothetical protein [uncultured Ilyobacter sp.]